MKTPLLGISSIVGFIKEDYSEFFKETEIPNYLGIIHNRVEYMESLINGIINYNAITNADINLEDFEILKEIQTILGQQCESSSVDLQLVNCPHNIKHSLNSFRQIFRDLISNSIKFTNKSNTEIIISFREDEDFYYFTYEDNGPGIPERYWEKVFALFEKLGTEGASDTGIGLTTIKALIDKLGGEIKIGNRKENKDGVNFNFTLSKNLV